MIGYVEAPMAWSLTHGMARVAGVNLPQAVLEGWISRKELATLVDRCQMCGKSVSCTSWLAEVASGALPGYCCNKAEIESLALGD